MYQKEGYTGEVRTARWRRSTKSGPYSDNCVEAAPLDGGLIAVRDSKYPDGSMLMFTPQEWAAFVDGAKAGEFDLSGGGWAP